MFRKHKNLQKLCLIRNSNSYLNLHLLPIIYISFLYEIFFVSHWTILKNLNKALEVSHYAPINRFNIVSRREQKESMIAYCKRL